MRYDHEGVEITLSITAFQTSPTDSGFDQQKIHHLTSCRADSAND